MTKNEENLENTSINLKAKLAGKELEIPADLYIPPEALEIFLELFEGPLDLLLYLIKKHNIDILDIPVAKIAEQYVVYVELMQNLRFDLAAEYLEMAAYLVEIKSRMLLPQQSSELEEQDPGNDPRAELVKRLQQYEKYRQAAHDLDLLARLERDIFLTNLALPDFSLIRPQPEIDLMQVLSALKDLLKRSELTSAHNIMLEPLSVRERMSIILAELQKEENKNKFVSLVVFFEPKEGRLGIVVCFLAILELSREMLIELAQSKEFDDIFLRSYIDSGAVLAEQEAEQNYA